MDGHVFPRKSANRFREGNFCRKKNVKSFSLPAMSHVCRTWRTSDNAGEIGAVIDITGR